MVLVYSPYYDNHQNSLHIENKSRTDSIIKKLDDENVRDYISVLEPNYATLDDLSKVHSLEHINFIKNFCKRGGGYIDYDTYATPLSYSVALMAAGGSIKASQLVMGGEKWAYSLARPPGHHANKKTAMGFCLFNNVAIAIENLRANYNIKKFLIIDFDVHYGNGTADIFYEDPEVLYLSIHQDPKTIFPGKGFISEQGHGSGEGYNLNLPMPPLSNNSDYIWILKELIGPLIKEFRPEMVFAEAGFDAHKKDLLSRILIDEDFYAWIGEYLMELHGSLVILLEGGYDLDALANSNLRFIKSMTPEWNLQYPYKTRSEIEHEYLAHANLSNSVKEILREVLDNFSPFFKF
ncbi:histone deacetylase family protein [Methanobacterium alcaliphilum]|uniref:histone deacetylase family protein n=1 Tax=Methanobacterium alcaliphilum TaxID=392018 RepID=UPI00200A92E8|nr:histone deacetylase [Methanobacterium alcaliphilum]MCK9151506.1 histone deacetylase [Methanobacterium alcaliphilum]